MFRTAAVSVVLIIIINGAVGTFEMYSMFPATL